MINTTNSPTICSTDNCTEKALGTMMTRDDGKVKFLNLCREHIPRKKSPRDQWIPIDGKMK